MENTVIFFNLLIIDKIETMNLLIYNIKNSHFEYYTDTYTLHADEFHSGGNARIGSLHK